MERARKVLGRTGCNVGEKSERSVHHNQYFCSWTLVSQGKEVCFGILSARKKATNNNINLGIDTIG